VVQITAVEQVKTRQGSVNFAPTFTIVKWLRRPADLDPEQLAASSASAAAEPRHPGDDDPFASTSAPAARLAGPSAPTPVVAAAIEDTVELAF
jgi:hypothetical protein